MAHNSSTGEKYNVQPGEAPWQDISLRRPREPYDRSGNLPPPTETYVSKLTRDDGEEIELTLEGFKEDAPSTIISSGLALWDASDLLCDYMATDRDFRESSVLRILELGAGLGKCGMVAHRLAHPPSGSATVLTDGDTNALQLLRKNVASNIDSPGIDISGAPLIQCQQLIWGKEAAQLFLRKQNNRPFDIIIGSDIIYKGEVYLRGLIDELFETVDVLLGKNGKFLLAHDESHEVRIETVNWGGDRHNMLHELVKTDGQKQLLCYRRLTMWNANSVIRRLTEKTFALEAENRALLAGKGHLETKVRSLEERCAALRGDADVPNITEFGTDLVAGVGSFLDAKDFVHLSATCRQFGLKTHNIRTRPVSLWEMVAHGLCESASEIEKESLPAYDQETSPLFFYNELVELRKPLEFSNLFGRGIDPAVGDPARIVNSNRSGVVKTPRGGRAYRACTAVANHVMKAGKHYVTFTCPGGSREGQSTLLWFGIVRPLKKLGPRAKSMFTPMCTRFVRELNAIRSEEWGASNVHCCVYVASTGKCQWTDLSGEENPDHGIHAEEWQGMTPFEGGTVSFLLDYDAGTLTVWKNDKCLGVMKDGLAGPYCWCAMVPDRYYSSDGIRIERDWGLELDDEDEVSSPPSKMPRGRGLSKSPPTV
ncbi:hypothetical protein ACHAXT_010856 [Thalassiosira profunda]